MTSRDGRDGADGLVSNDSERSEPEQTRPITFDVPAGQRLGQAIVNALKKSEDWSQFESQSTLNGKPLSHTISYSVKGRDLFYLSDSELQELVTDLVKNSVEPK